MSSKQKILQKVALSDLLECEKCTTTTDCKCGNYSQQTDSMQIIVEIASRCCLVDAVRYYLGAGEKYIEVGLSQNLDFIFAIKIVNVNGAEDDLEEQAVILVPSQWKVFEEVINVLWNQRARIYGSNNKLYTDQLDFSRFASEETEWKKECDDDDYIGFEHTRKLVERYDGDYNAIVIKQYDIEFNLSREILREIVNLCEVINYRMDLMQSMKFSDFHRQAIAKVVKYLCDVKTEEKASVLNIFPIFNKVCNFETCEKSRNVLCMIEMVRIYPFSILSSINKCIDRFKYLENKFNVM